MAVARCRSCGALIVWARTRSGRAIPLDARWTDGVPKPLYTPDGNLIAIEDIAVGAGGPGLLVEHAPRNGTPRWRAHFATCPNADDWRKDAQR